MLPIRVDGAVMPDALADVYYLELNAQNLKEIADRIVTAIPEHQLERAGRAVSRRQARTSAGSPSARSSSAAALSPVHTTPTSPISARLLRADSHRARHFLPVL